jgi:hypothetical protein
MIWGSIPERGYFSSELPDRFWVSPNLLFNGLKVFASGVKRAGGLKLTTHLYLVPRLRMTGANLFSHLRLCGMCRDSSNLHQYLLTIDVIFLKLIQWTK